MEHDIRKITFQEGENYEAGGEQIIIDPSMKIEYEDDAMFVIKKDEIITVTPYLITKYKGLNELIMIFQGWLNGQTTIIDNLIHLRGFING